MSRKALDEEALIARFLAPFPKGERVVLGPGSDCAAVEVARGQKLVSTTDAVVEGVHFDWRWFSPEQVGHKALAVNLSDLAAASARPRWFLCALGIPTGAGVSNGLSTGDAVRMRTGEVAARAQGIARGMAKLAKRFGCALIGGNVTAAREWSITITALGESPRPLSRTGARPGDAIVVCGQLGGAAAGLRGLRESDAKAGLRALPASDRQAASRGTGGRVAVSRPSLNSPRARAAAVRAQRLPEPLVEAGLAARGVASAAIDVSDGFLRDLGRLCAASGVGAAVDCGALTIAAGASLDDALTGGEDYALVWAVPKRKLARLPGACAQVGKFTLAKGVRVFEDGQLRREPHRTGFDHLG